MKLEEFIEKFSAEFEMTPKEDITANTTFRNIDEWDSLLSLSIIGMIKNTYNIRVSGQEINSVNTVEELFNLVKKKL